jgi:hypothetical protein
MLGVLPLFPVTLKCWLEVHRWKLSLAHSLMSELCLCLYVYCPLNRHLYLHPAVQP